MITRYSLDRCEPVMDVEDDGEWCKWEDAEQQLASVQAELEDAKADAIDAREFAQEMREDRNKGEEFWRNENFTIRKRAEAAERERDELRAQIDNDSIIWDELVKERDELRERLESKIAEQCETYKNSKAYWESENQALREELEQYRGIAMAEGAEKALADYRILQAENERYRKALGEK